MCIPRLITCVVTTGFLLQFSTLEAQPQPDTRRPVYRLGLLPHTLNIGSEDISINYPDNWSLAHPTANTWVILNLPVEQIGTVEPTVRVQIGYLHRGSHADALEQLNEFANEYRTAPKFRSIGGWPALERLLLLSRPQPSQAPQDPDPMMVQTTTAVAAGTLLVRLDGRLPSDADQELKDLVLDIGRSLRFRTKGNPAITQQEVKELKALPRRIESPQAGSVKPDGATPHAASSNIAFAGSGPIVPIANLVLLGMNNGEAEVAVSNNGTNIIVARQSTWVRSTNAGQTFTFGGSLPVNDGDSSVSFGQSGNFYHAALACFNGTCAAPCPANSTCIEIANSTNNGVSFSAPVNAVVCANGTCSVDQEHIAADRINAGATATQDRVYMGFRQCQGGCGNESDIACSTDSGANWTPRLALENGADFPRVAVGSDGSFYVVYQVGANIRIDKYNACSNPMTRVVANPPFPRTVSAFTQVPGCGAAPPNGFPGLDRCNNGNTLSSPTVAVDDTNPNHIYVAWANNTAANNENILVADSTDGGTTWRAPVTVNNNVNARRFMPWMCATGGAAFVSWFDRRNATAANNDLTDYFAASAGLSGGNLVRSNDEFRISANSDPQCRLWPSAPRNQNDSENCSVQPQLAGTCSVTTNQRCDFNPNTCPVTGGVQETCQTGGGTPKYGDYTGNACILGRLYATFPSGLSAAGGNLGNVNNFFQSFVVNATPTTATYTGPSTGVYHHSVTLSGTLVLQGTTSPPVPIVGQTLTFTIGAQSCNGVTDASGSASCTLTLNQVPGSYTVNTNFAGAGNFQASSDSDAFTITKQPTTLTYSGDTVIANNTPAHMTGTLLDDNNQPVVGRTVTFTLGTGVTAQTCNGTTNTSGVATCDIIAHQPLGPGQVKADFAGDAFYLPSSAGPIPTILFAFLEQGGFVVGNSSAAGTVEFWGSDWSRQNVLSGGDAPNTFKGFAATVSTNPPKCGDTWTSRTGNSPPPPDGPLPAYMGVLVSSSVIQQGATISGNVPKIIVVTPNAGYSSDPGHPGTAVVVATYCQ